MRTEKIHFFILIVSLIICLFIFLETYFLPTNSRKEIVQSIEGVRKRGRSNSWYDYYMKTNAGDYAVTGSIYEAVNIGDTVLMSYAFISGCLQKYLCPGRITLIFILQASREFIQDSYCYPWQFLVSFACWSFTGELIVCKVAQTLALLCLLE